MTQIYTYTFIVSFSRFQLSHYISHVCLGSGTKDIMWPMWQLMRWSMSLCVAGSACIVISFGTLASPPQSLTTWDPQALPKAWQMYIIIHIVSARMVMKNTHLLRKRQIKVKYTIYLKFQAKFSSFMVFSHLIIHVMRSAWSFSYALVWAIYTVIQYDLHFTWKMS